jgi:NADH-quinone oxidoreductase subunit N
MNASLMSLEIAVAILALGILLGDLWTKPEQKRNLGNFAAVGVGAIFTLSIFLYGAHLQDENWFKLFRKPFSPFAFNGMFAMDELAFFFKPFFLLAAFLVLVMATEYADRIHTGISEFYSIILFALCGMLFAASANDFMLVFVSLELITVSFYVLNSFQRSRIISLEAGVKYLILGALSTAFLVFGIALIFGATGETNFTKIQAAFQETPALAGSGIFLLGLLFVIVGLGFKIAAFPFQIWAPDVYQGSPAPATAFLAVGSKAAGIVLLMRLLFGVFPEVAAQWSKLLMLMSGITILYGNLCALPQRNLKRLLGYSSISNAGYLLLGFTALNEAGASAILYFLAGYLFSVLAAFTVICIVTRQTESDDITVLAGLGRRSPFLAATMTLAMVSLAGIPPLAGFFGKFLLLKAVVEKGAMNPGYYCLAAVAVAGVVMSLYYYFGVIRAIYWSKETSEFSPITISVPTRAALMVCIAGMLYLGLQPDSPVRHTQHVAASLYPKPDSGEMKAAEIPGDTKVH